MIIPIIITFLIESSHQIQFDQKHESTMTNKTQAFLRDSLTIELHNSSNLISYLKMISVTRKHISLIIGKNILPNLISTKTSHSESIKFPR
jgi:hypothetical protein